ncbi:MAG TPA: tRNA glutamyl-Q(34) synthetase GluQRS [Isosphaeraceae bacterium]|jgi:glutamyl-tRNA synthetase|nr:tRNA glutamyl-Q(34) synthetase GluQRS [Isosphaeraceae bacterium]
MNHLRTDLPRSPTVGRLAPSPTGGLHLGNARTFLIAWLDARSRGGEVVLRIEDIDASRVRPEAITGAVADLAWLGLDWDDGPILQSSRLGHYREALDRLRVRELVYPCTCTRADIARSGSAPHASDEGPTYPGTCADRSAGDANALGDRPFAWRFRVPQGSVDWDDLYLGPMALDPSLVGGDFVVGRSNGPPSYQLAVVVDDAAMGVNRVVRGDDLTTSTPRQILIDDALGLPRPDFGQVPLVVEPDGRRLAKRDRSIKLATLRDRGVDPRRLVGWLARSCGWSAEIEPSRPADWIDRFDWRAIPNEPAVLLLNDLAGPDDRGADT